MKSFLGAIRRAISWHRRALAVVAAVLGTVLLASALAPAEPASAWAVVTTRAVPAGEVLAATDVTRVRLPERSLPDLLVSDPADVVGRMALGPLPRNTILSTAAVFTSGDLQASPGKAIMPLRLQEEGLQGLLTVGTRVDLIGFSSATGSAQVLARDVRIVAIPTVAASGTFQTSAGEGMLVLIEVSPDAASALATAAVASRLTVIIT
ncbi:SAF domain-containing protein [Propionicicella superfundia]|uniref:SAF domain-containing protein n=1 Tax=Propionicicella superfundia TaxID=348582 RepID=UPI00040AB594|nr:SAF domain-containing protein [Propionicicella superfundia]